MMNHLLPVTAGKQAVNVAVDQGEWTFGGSSGNKEYLVHRIAPRFIVRVVACQENGEPEPGELPVDLSGMIHRHHDKKWNEINYVLCELELIDPLEPHEIENWLKSAMRAQLAGGA